MANIIVDTSVDENDGSIGDGDISLRDAIAAADAGDTITFASGSGEAFENPATIRLVQGLGELVLSADVSIDGDTDGDGAPDVTVSGDTLGDDPTTTDPLGNTVTDAILGGINGNDNVGVFNVTGGSSAINGLVITGGSVTSNTGSGGGVRVAEGAALALSNSSVSGNFSNRFDTGGGIENGGMVTLTDTTVSGNRSNYWGGGIHNTGIATLTDSAVLGNRSNYGGGGVFNDGTLTMAGTTVSDNGSGWYLGSRDRGGGGIYNNGTATLTNTTVSGNSSADGGGGILNNGTATLSNVTVAGNSTNDVGGGVLNAGTAAVRLASTTVSVNSAGYSGGGIYTSQTATATLANSLVLGNAAPAGPEIDGPITEIGPNIIRGNAGDVFAAIDPATGGGLLADNDGSVRTIALKNDASNPALDSGQDEQLEDSVVGIDLNGDGDIADVIETDARGGGFARLVDLVGAANNGANTLDLGALELQANVAGLIPVRITFTGESAGYANAFGIYDTSTLRAELLAADLNQTADGAVLYEADLTPQQLGTLGFFLLPDGAGQNADLAELVGEPLTVEDTGAGYAVSFNETSLSGLNAPALFSEAALNPGGIDHFIEDGTPARYSLSVEDQVGGGDLQFNDALFELEAGVARTGAEVTVTFESESAGFRNTFGYFLSDSGEAEIVFADIDQTTLAPGATEAFNLTAEEVDNLEFFLIPDGARLNADLFSDLDALDLTVEEVDGALRVRDQATDTVLEGAVNPVYVPEASGNPDAMRHALQVGDVDGYTLSWEDLPGDGDDEADYNDNVVSVDITPDEILI